MALSTYTDLKAAIAAWLWRDNLTDQIPEFIDLAESRIAKRLRVSEMETTATAFMTDGMVPVPTDFIEARRLISSGSGAFNTPLGLITPDYAGATYASSDSGVPRHYTITGGVLTTFPNGGTDQVTMIYYAKPPPLATNETNWLLTKAPDVYLYGSLVESAPFEQDDARMQTWAALFDRAIGELQAADQRSRYANMRTRVRCETP